MTVPRQDQMILDQVCGESASDTPDMSREWKSNTLPALLARYRVDDV